MAADQSEPDSDEIPATAELLALDCEYTLAAIPPKDEEDLRRWEGGHMRPV